MTVSHWLIFCLSLAAGAAGLSLLYATWKIRAGGYRLLLGWACLLLGCVFATLANGDRGLAQYTVGVMLILSVFFTVAVARGMPRLDFAKRRRKEAVVPEPSPTRPGSVLSSICTFFLSGPLAGLIAAFASAALFKLIRPETGNPATAGIIAILSTVILWGLISTLLLIEWRLSRRAIYTVAGIAISGAAAFI
ncbi:MAG: hypothetical protein CMK06_13040 [Ponticaulis sp.]|nr:hypothetical protein [Ponticaulis sp.]